MKRDTDTCCTASNAEAFPAEGLIKSPFTNKLDADVHNIGYRLRMQSQDAHEAASLRSQRAGCFEQIQKLLKEARQLGITDEVEALCLQFIKKG